MIFLTTTLTTSFGLYKISIRLFPRLSTRQPLELPGVLPRHARPVPRAFAAFPEAVAFLADKPRVADAAVFGAVVLFARAWGFR